MKVLEFHIYQVFEYVWTTMVGMTLQRRSFEFFAGLDSYFIVTHIGINGAWQGEVALACDADLAQYIAAQFFSISPAVVTDEDVREAMYELGNTIAGHLKRVLPEPTVLQVPVVGQGDQLKVQVRISEHHRIPRVFADCNGWPLLLALHQRQGYPVV